MLFDTHAHLDDRAFDQDRQTLLARLPEQGSVYPYADSQRVRGNETGIERKDISLTYEHHISLYNMLSVDGKHLSRAYHRDRRTEKVRKRFKGPLRSEAKIKAYSEIKKHYDYQRDTRRVLCKA